MNKLSDDIKTTSPPAPTGQRCQHVTSCLGIGPLVTCLLDCLLVTSQSLICDLHLLNQFPNHSFSRKQKKVAKSPSKAVNLLWNTPCSNKSWTFTHQSLHHWCVCCWVFIFNNSQSEPSCQAKQHHLPNSSVRESATFSLPSFVNFVLCH